MDIFVNFFRSLISLCRRFSPERRSGSSASYRKQFYVYDVTLRWWERMNDEVTAQFITSFPKNP
jgi:hypothetical protein